MLSLGNARPTNLRMKSRHLIGKLHAASRAGYSVCLHRPTQGWTVGEYILLCKVSRLHPPSSLGLDGEGKPQPHHDDQQEVQKEPSSTYIPIGICWSFMKVERRHLVENIAQMVPPYRSVGTARSGSVVPLISV